MFPYHLLVASLLLASPADGLEKADAAALFKEFAPALRKLAIAGEILDPRETEHILARPEDFAADLKLLGERNRDLAGAPLLIECRRFPERAMVDDLLAFNRSFQKDLEARLPLDPIHAEDVRVVLRENEQLHHIWDTVRQARCQFYYVSVRRQALKELRALIGAEAYDAGQLPPNVPTWRIPEN